MSRKSLIMKRIILLLMMVTSAMITLVGQVPNGMKYQAVVRDTWGRIIENKTVGVKIEILQYTEEGDAVFIEEHQRTTNEYGLIYLVIGSVNEQGFEDIDWSTGPYYIEVGIDIDGGTNYERYGTSELLSVPYALYALEAETGGGSIDTLYINDTTDINFGRFIANVVDDYGAVGDGLSDNAEAFLNALNENNEIFIPSADNNYLISNLFIPSGKRLWFENGAVLDIINSINGEATEIIAGDYQIFTSSSTLAGTWKGGVAYDSWLGNGQPMPGMEAMVTTADTTRWGYHVPVIDSAYSIAWDGSTDVATRNAIYDKIESLEISGGSAFIANVVDDYAAIGDGATDNALAFSNALSENNDIFIPSADNNYLISNLVIPSGKRLWFENGAVLDVTNSITGDVTEIVAGDYQIFTSSSTLAGTWKGGIAYDSWLGNGQPMPGIDAMVTTADTTRWGYHVPVIDSAYSIAWDGSTDVATRNAIYDKIESLEISGGSAFIANVVDDYAAIGDGATDNALAFSNALSENNDIFIPSADNNYLISNLVIPSGKRLWFENGAVLDITNSITGDTTEIIAGDYQIFTSSSTITGTWKGGVAYDKWSGKNEQIPGMHAMITPADTARWAIDTFGSGSFIANIIDYGAIADGTTDNTEALEDALMDNEDVFIPAGDSTYIISSLTIPHGKRLWFESKAKLDVTGTLTGNTTEIMAGDQELFTNTSTLDGTWKSAVSFDSWSGKNNQIPGMSAMVTPADTARWGIDTFGSGSFIANVIDYGAAGDGTTNDSAAFAQAFAQNNDVFVPNTNYDYRISGITIPEGSRIWFEGGAVLDITNNMTIKGEIKAGHHQIFTLSSADKIDASKATASNACPEWFGANGFDGVAGNDAKAINKALQVFKNVNLIYNARYYIDETIYPPLNSHIHGNNAILRADNSFNASMIYWNQPLCSVEELTIEVPNYKLRGGSPSNAYTSWVLVHNVDYPNTSGREYRRAFFLKDVAIVETGPYIAPQHWTPNVRFNGFKAAVPPAVESNYISHSYFGDVYNLHIRYGYDTAVHLVHDFSTGADHNNNHLNSWYFQNCKFDYGLTHIVIDSMSRGHSFDNTMCQTYYASPNQSYMHKPGIIIDGSIFNRIDVRFEDIINTDSLIVFRDGSSYNTITTEDIRIKRFVKNEVTMKQRKYSNLVGPSPYFDVQSSKGFKPTTPLDDWTFDNNVTIEGVLKLKPRAAPSNPTEGMIYVNSSNHHIYCYLNGVWRQLD